MLRFLSLILAVSLVAGDVRAQGPTPVGIWLHDNKRIQIEIAPCGDRLCGKIIWLKRPNDVGGQPLVDLKNSNPAQRTRPLMGLTILRNLCRTGDRSWGEGRVYNPDDGEDYRANITMHADGTLRVRAYVLLPLFGKTFTWTRVR